MYVDSKIHNLKVECCTSSIQHDTCNIVHQNCIALSTYPHVAGTTTFRGVPAITSSLDEVGNIRHKVNISLSTDTISLVNNPMLHL